jgi:hypothetical protein
VHLIFFDNLFASFKILKLSGNLYVFLAVFYFSFIILQKMDFQNNKVKILKLQL